MAGPAWDDLKTLGMRLNRLIKYSETMLKKTDRDDHDGKNRYITTIVSLTRQQLEVIKIKDKYDEVLGWFDSLHQDENARMKLNVREMKKQDLENKRELQAERDRGIEAGKQVRAQKKRHEIEEEKLVRRQAAKMKNSKELRL